MPLSPLAAMQRNVDEAQRERRTYRGLLLLRRYRRECTVELRPEALNGRDNSDRDTGSVRPFSGRCGGRL